MAQTVRVEQAMRELEQHLSAISHVNERYAALLWLMQEVEEELKALGLFDALLAGSRLSLFAKLHYLPAARVYSDAVFHKDGSARQREASLTIRGRLGAQTRGLYAVQRPVFDLTVETILSIGVFWAGNVLGLTLFGLFTMTPANKLILDLLWRRLQQIESKQLSAARRHAKDAHYRMPAGN